VRVTEDEIIAHLADGRGHQRSAGLVLATFGGESKATRDFSPHRVRPRRALARRRRGHRCRGNGFTGSRRIARDRHLPALQPGPYAIRNRRTSESSRRAASVVPKPGVVARAADAARSPHRRRDERVAGSGRRG
jgi:hypothetical protein